MRVCECGRECSEMWCVGVSYTGHNRASVCVCVWGGGGGGGRGIDV